MAAYLLLTSEYKSALGRVMEVHHFRVYEVFVDLKIMLI